VISVGKLRDRLIVELRHGTLLEGDAEWLVMLANENNTGRRVIGRMFRQMSSDDALHPASKKDGKISSRGPWKFGDSGPTNVRVSWSVMAGRSMKKMSEVVTGLSSMAAAEEFLLGVAGLASEHR
jgi:hypothetical protein